MKYKFVMVEVDQKVFQIKSHAGIYHYFMANNRKGCPYRKIYRRYFLDLLIIFRASPCVDNTLNR